MNQDNKDPQLKLLNQGTFGCIFKPGIDCNGQIQTDKKFITKIQNSKNTSENEVHIGELIQSIPKYERFFSPIIENCQVDLSIIQNNEINKCDFIKDNKNNNKPLKFESNIIKYAGKNTLFEYYEHTQNHGIKLLEHICNSHIRLLTALNKLNEQNIIHYDLKQNNIMCKTNGYPIIIDFGISIDTTRINPDNYIDLFYAYGPEYVPWCIEIHVISKIVHTRNWRGITIDMPFISSIIDDFFTKNVEINKLFDDNEKTLLRKTYNEYFKTIIGGAGAGGSAGSGDGDGAGSGGSSSGSGSGGAATGIISQYFSQESSNAIHIINTLLQNSKCWDNYSIAFIYLRLIHIFKLDSKNTETNDIMFLKEYIIELKQIIMAPPDKRLLPLSTKNTIKQIFAYIKKQDIIIIKNKVLNNDNFKKSIEKIQKYKTQSIRLPNII
jgi:serine/threonine protein kinase